MISKNPFVAKSVIVMLVLATAFIPLSVWAEEIKPGIISTTGVGNIDVAPDMAMISLGVFRQAKTAREALDANNAAMKEVMAAIKKQGVEDKDLQTSNFQINPRYRNPKKNKDGSYASPTIDGYNVSNNLTVRIRDLTKLGNILDKVVTLGVNTGGGIRFMNDDTETILKQARIAAVKDAMEKAQTLTSTAGVGLGRILTIQENHHQPRPMAMAQASMAKMASPEAVPVAAGENTYRVNVNITWEIAQ